MSVIAVIPARGGSKGIPGKNLQRVGGVSLVGRAVRSALSVSAIDRVIVSTDDEAIAREARNAGAETILRPAELAGDTATSEAALMHALQGVAAAPRILVFLQATSPFIDTDALATAITRVRAGHCDVSFAATRSHAFLWRTASASADDADGIGDAEGINHDSGVRQRRQDRPAEWLETGAFYVMRAAGFRQAAHRFFGRIEVAPVAPSTAIEIDSAEDLDRARALASLFDHVEPIDVDALVTDFDGVHTDDRVSIGGDGSERVTTSRSDGLGIEFLRNAGYPLLILSKETNRVVTVRARKLGVDVRQGLDDKAAVLQAWAAARGLDLARVAYLGNDLNDLACMGLVGWPIAVADAHRDVLTAARVVLERTGGHGAIRELSERILQSGRSNYQKEEEQWQSPLAAFRSETGIPSMSSQKSV